jgi:hypothetical protein
MLRRRKGGPGAVEPISGAMETGALRAPHNRY